MKKKPIVKKTVGAAKPVFSFGASSGTAKKTVIKKTVIKKSVKPTYTVKKSTGTTIKKKPIVRSKPIATVKATVGAAHVESGCGP
jgi:hypothetical protein